MKLNKKTVTITNSYFHRVARETPTQLWINSATQADLGLALAVGAVGNTANPSHPPRAIKADREIWYPVIDDILRSEPNLSDDEVADIMTQHIQARSVKMFQPMYEESNGKYGTVAIQGNPNTNNDLEQVVKSGITYSKLGENIIVKVVSTAVGMKALEELAARGINTIATNGFSVAQAIAMAEAYERGLKRTNRNPKCYIVHIAGLFDEYLAELGERRNINVSPEHIHQAGVTVTRAIYRIFQERCFKCKVHPGGSRAPYHFTELVGGDLPITISIGQVRELLAENPPVVSRIDAETPPKVLAELEDKFLDFRRAYYPDGLTPDQFRDFGPCAKFQSACLNGYAETLAEIQARRRIVEAR